MSEIEKYKHWLLCIARLAKLKHYHGFDINYKDCGFNDFCNKPNGHGETELERSVKLFSGEVKQIFA